MDFHKKKKKTQTYVRLTIIYPMCSPSPLLSPGQQFLMHFSFSIHSRVFLPSLSLALSSSSSSIARFVLLFVFISHVPTQDDPIQSVLSGSNSTKKYDRITVRALHIYVVLYIVQI